MTDQFQLTDDQLAIQDMARKFTADRITPYAAEWDETHHYPVDVWKAAGELGFGAIYVGEASGGISKRVFADRELRIERAPNVSNVAVYVQRVADNAALELASRA